MSAPLVIVERDEGVAVIRLNDPARLNCLSMELVVQLETRLVEVANDSSVSAVVITGAGRAFCAGGDVRSMARNADDATFVERLATQANKAINVFMHMPVITVSAVHGVVAGGGIGLMLAADLIVAEKGSRFVAGYDKLAVTPDCSLSYLLPRAIGRVRTLSFLHSGEPITAERALEWGMVSQLCETGQAAHTATALGRHVAQTQSQTVPSAVRGLVDDAHHSTLETALQREAVAIGVWANTQVARERIAQFAQT